jgi:hypothetical protein
MSFNGLIKTVNIVGVPGGTTYVVDVADDYINCYTLNGPVTLVLPRLNDNWNNLANKTYYITDKTSTTTSNNITIAASDGTINYVASVAINKNGMISVVTAVNISLWIAKFQYILGEPATQIAFDNTSTALSATNVQAAIVELATGGGGGGAGNGELIDLGDRLSGGGIVDGGSRL